MFFMQRYIPSASWPMKTVDIIISIVGLLSIIVVSGYTLSAKYHSDLLFWVANAAFLLIAILMVCLRGKKVSQ